MQELIDLVTQFGVEVALLLYFVWWTTQHLNHKLDRIIRLLEIVSKT